MLWLSAVCANSECSTALLPLADVEGRPVSRLSYSMRSMERSQLDKVPEAMSSSTLINPVGLCSDKTIINAAPY
jgi:hypothetical protein